MRRNNVRTGLARKQRHQRYKIRSWVNRLIDCPAFIIGNSPSLNDEPIHLLEDYFSIGINRCFYKIDPTILMWQDISLWNTEYHKLHSSQALKVSRDVSDPRKVYYNFHLKGNGYKFDLTSTHIFHGRGSTGPIAVQLAVAMGCRPIVLLGMDCNRGENGHSDFWGNNDHWTEATVSNCKLGLEFIKEQCPVEVYNCGSAVEFWPRSSLESVLDSISNIHKIGRAAYVRRILNLD